MKTGRLVSLGFALVLAALAAPAQEGSAASPPSEADAIIRLEARWITAILNGDSTTVAAILSENFKHITLQGRCSIVRRSWRA